MSPAGCLSFIVRQDMKLLKICPNEAEAAFLVSLLESEGVPSFTSDSGVQMSGVSHVRLEVSDEDFERAHIIVSRKEAKHPQVSESRDDHPSVGFPFLGVMGFITMLAVVGGTCRNVWLFYQGRWEAGTTVGQVIAVSIPVSTFFGLVGGCMIAFVGVLARPIFKKMKGGEPGATDNPGDAQ